MVPSSFFFYVDIRQKYLAVNPTNPSPVLADNFPPSSVTRWVQFFPPLKGELNGLTFFLTPFPLVLMNLAFFFGGTPFFWNLDCLAPWPSLFFRFWCFHLSLLVFWFKTCAFFPLDFFHCRFTRLPTGFAVFESEFLFFFPHVFLSPCFIDLGTQPSSFSPLPWCVYQTEGDQHLFSPEKLIDIALFLVLY